MHICQAPSRALACKHDALQATVRHMHCLTLGAAPSLGPSTTTLGRAGLVQALHRAGDRTVSHRLTCTG